MPLDLVRYAQIGMYRKYRNLLPALLSSWADDDQPTNLQRNAPPSLVHGNANQSHRHPARKMGLELEFQLCQRQRFFASGYVRNPGQFRDAALRRRCRQQWQDVPVHLASHTIPLPLMASVLAARWSVDQETSS
jgi:hypothetical protein